MTSVPMTVTNADIPKPIQESLLAWLTRLVLDIRSGRLSQERVAALSSDQGLDWLSTPMITSSVVRSWSGRGFAKREDDTVSVFATVNDYEGGPWRDVLVAYADVAEVWTVDRKLDQSKPMVTTVNPYTVDLGLDLMERLERTAALAAIDRPILLSDESKNLFAEAVAEIERLRQEGLALFSANQELRREVERSRAFIDRLLVEVGELPPSTPDDRLVEAAKNAIRRADVMTERVRIYLPGSSSTIGQPSEDEIGDHMSPAMRRVYDEARKDAQR